MWNLTWQEHACCARDFIVASNGKTYGETPGNSLSEILSTALSSVSMKLHQDAGKALNCYTHCSFAALRTNIDIFICYNGI